MKVDKRNETTGEVETLDINGVAETARYLLLNGIPMSHVRSAVKLAYRLAQVATIILVLGNAVGSASVPQYLARVSDIEAAKDEFNAALKEVVASVDQLGRQYGQDRLERLDIQIFNLRRDYCKESSPALKAQLADRVEELKRRYNNATGTWPRIATCDET